MIGRMPLLTPALLASLLALTGPAQPAAGNDATANVRVYRCVGSNGQVALQDAPCRQGNQQILELARPKDPPVQPPPPTPAAASNPAPASAAPPSRVVVIHSEPLFECVTPEGERYTADDGQGNPRWVPGPLVAVHLGPGHAHRPGRPPMHRPSLPPGNGGRHPHPPAHSPHHASVLVPAGGQWVRDSCQRLSRQEACSLLAEQRWELISRYNSALSSEREQLVREQRRVEQRMERQPCGH